ncbi:MAG: T9SS type A sorting domain-containing protein [Bacteroidota bacterium]
MKQLRFFSCLLALILSRHLAGAQPVPPDYLLPNFPAAVGLDVPRPNNVICHNFFDVVANNANIPTVQKQGNVHLIDQQIELAVNAVGLSVPDPNDLHVLYFPQGTYEIRQQQNINRNNVVIRGEGATRTVFKWTGPEQYCFNALGPDPLQAPTFPATGLENNFFVNSPAVANNLPNGTLLLFTRDDPEPNCEPTFIRQYARKTGDLFNVFLILDTRLRIGYDANANNGRLRLHIPRQFVGFECFKIDASSNSDANRSGSNHSNITFQRAANCWMEGVESYLGVYQHVIITESSNIEVRGCYLHDVIDDDGGEGYGINIQNGSGECLIIDNVLKTLRHAILLQRGANGNAVVYNYSEDSKDYPGRSDMTFHANFPFRNLVEGNSFEKIHFDLRSGCRNGPGNIVFRNETTRKNILSGAPFTPAVTGATAVIANESDNCINLYGNNNLYDTWDNIENGWLCGNANGDNGDNTPNGNSVLFATRPAFLNTNSFPTFGPGANNNAVLPARQRGTTGALNTVGGNCNQCRPVPPLSVTANTIPCSQNGFNNFAGFITLSISGGTPPYTVAWTGNFVSTSNTLAQFANPTLWTAVVTDNAGQTVSQSDWTGPCTSDGFFKNEENPTSPEPSTTTPRAFTAQVYPNPFRDAAQLRLDLPDAVPIRVELYGTDGKIARALYRGPLKAGLHQLKITRSDLPTGLYFCRITAGDDQRVLRLIVQ